MLPQAVSELYRAQQRRIVATLGLARREWAAMGDDFDASWATVGPRVQLLTASAQLGAARSGARSVPDALAQQRIRVTPEGDVNAATFAGWASDGRQLGSLLYQSVITAKQQVAAGLSPADALAAGGRALDLYVHTMVADAARQAASVAIAARPRVGYVRMVNPPCCSRCAQLAGTFYRYNQGFQRHPRCDCTHTPTTEAAAPNVTTEPSLDQITDLSKNERKALDEGADLSQVVNARRGASGMTTTEGTTKRGLAGTRLAGRRRLTPDGIFRISSDRDQALALLKQHGYLL